MGAIRYLVVDHPADRLDGAVVRTSQGHPPPALNEHHTVSTTKPLETTDSGKPLGRKSNGASAADRQCRAGARQPMIVLDASAALSGLLNAGPARDSLAG